MKQIKPYHTPRGNAIQEPAGGTQRPTKGKRNPISYLQKTL